MFLFVISCIGLHAQESVNASGGKATGSGGSASYSVGQVVYTTILGTNGSVTQGIQQPYEISVLSTIEEAQGIRLVATAYPNPTVNELTLKIDAFDISNVSYLLYNNNGRVLQREPILHYITSIDMSKYTPSIYYVKIIQGDTEIKTFKIIKH
ncbi:MAG TPA: T9SS type A sorting domain-containing protein [Bacteroidales bacterium]|nr:T9SS type A sorting domain-containing protein [Bacteroidales bacterium]